MLGLRVTQRSEIRDAVREAMDCPGPVLIDFMVEEEENVYPMIPAGKSVEDLIEEPIQVEEKT